jgi:hypothetical protein
VDIGACMEQSAGSTPPSFDIRQHRDDLIGKHASTTLDCSEK